MIASPNPLGKDEDEACADDFVLFCDLFFLVIFFAFGNVSPRFKSFGIVPVEKTAFFCFLCIDEGEERDDGGLALWKLLAFGLTFRNDDDGVVGGVFGSDPHTGFEPAVMASVAILFDLMASLARDGKC